MKKTNFIRYEDEDRKIQRLTEENQRLYDLCERQVLEIAELKDELKRQLNEGIEIMHRLSVDNMLLKDRLRQYENAH